MSDDQQAAAPAVKKRSALRWVVRLVLVLLLVTVVVIIFLPGIISGAWGKGQITRAINNTIEGEVRIDSLSLAWFRGQKINGIRLTDPDGQIVGGVGLVSVDVSLWSLLWGERDLGKIEIVQPMLEVTEDATGETNLQKAIALRRPMPETPDEPAGPIALPVTFTLVVTEGKITAVKPGIDPVKFEDVNIVINAADVAANGLSFDLRTRTQQGQLSGNVAVAGRVRGFDAEGNLEPKQAQVEATVDVTDLPMAGIDTLAGLNGLLPAALGDRLTVKVETKPEGDQQIATVMMQSTHLDVNLNASVTEDQATTDGTVMFTLTPALVAKLAGDTGTTLADNVPIRVAIDSLRGPMGAFDPAKVAAAISLTIGDGTIHQPDQLGTLAWRNTAATINTENLSQLLTATMTSDFTHSGRQGQVVLREAKLSNLFSDAGKPQPDKMAIDAHLAVTNLPTRLLDTLAKADGVVVEAAGDWLSITLSSESTGAERISIDAAITSPNITANLPLLVTDRIAIKPGETGSATMNVAPTLLKKYVTDKAGYAVALGQPITLTIDQLNAPRPAEDQPLFQPKDTTLRLVVALADVTVTDPVDSASPIGPLVIPVATLTLHGDKLDQPRVTGDVRIAADDGLFRQYASRNLAMKLTATTTLSDDLQNGPLQIVLEGRSLQRDGRDALQAADVAGTLTADFATFTLDQPAVVRYTVMPELLAADPGEATLAGPMPVTLTLDALSSPVKDFSLAGVKTQLTAAIERAVLAGDEQIAGTTMTGATANITLDGPANTLAFAADATTQLPNQPAGGLKVNGNLSRWLNDEAAPDIANAVGKVTANITDLPAAFIDALGKQGGRITEALGQSVNVNLTYEATAARQTNIAFDAKSPLLTADGAFDMTDGKPLTASKPLTLDWQLTPAMYRKLSMDAQNPNAPPTLELTDPVRVTAALPRLVLPPLAAFTATEDGDQPRPRPDASQYAAAGNITLSRIAMKQVATGSQVSADDLKVVLDAPTLERARTTATGTFAFVDAKAPQQTATGQLNAVATLTDLFDESGPSMDADVQLAEVPVVFVDVLAKADGLALAALGDRINLNLKANLKHNNGPITATVRSDHSKADVAAVLRDGTMTFTKPLTAELTVTEALGRELLAKINPIFEGAKTADEPLRLTIPEKDLVIPLTDFDLAKVKMPVMMVELGRMNAETQQYDVGAITLDPGNVLVGLIRFAQRYGALRGRSTDEMSLNFTPIVVKLDNGRITYLRRLDLLIGDSFHVASWGHVQLDMQPDDPKDNSSVSTFIGIPGRMLDRSRILSGAGDDETFTIPVRGTLSAPAVDWVAAATDMGTLQAQYRLISHPVLGQAARQLVQRLLKQEQNRPPALSISPLPWTVTRTPDPADPAQPEQPAEQPGEQPAEQPAQPEPERERTIEERLIEEGLRQIFR